MPNNVKDDYGMPLSTSSPDAAEGIREGLRRLLSQNFGTEEKFGEADEQAAAQGWQDGDPDSPGIANLTRLAAVVN